MTKLTLHQQLTKILKLGWAPAWSIQAALRIQPQPRFISESTCGRQLRLLRQLRNDVETRPGKGRAQEWRISRTRKAG